MGERIKIMRGLQLLCCYSLLVIFYHNTIVVLVDASHTSDHDVIEPFQRIAGYLPMTSVTDYVSYIIYDDGNIKYSSFFFVIDNIFFSFFSLFVFVVVLFLKECN